MVLNFHCNKWIRGGDPTKVSGGLFYKKKNKQKNDGFALNVSTWRKKKWCGQINRRQLQSHEATFCI